MTEPIQFNWRRHWSKKVAPHLDKPLVTESLAIGMRNIDPSWRKGCAPFTLGIFYQPHAHKNKLTWYQPSGRCHWISYFSMAIGVLNYPDLDWRFLMGERHTIPVGYGPDGMPVMVMDILRFDDLTAAQSIAFAMERLSVPDGRELFFLWAEFEKTMIPKLRSLAHREAAKKQRGRVSPSRSRKIPKKTAPRKQLAKAA